jgi:hypothetical protein
MKNNCLRRYWSFFLVVFMCTAQFIFTLSVDAQTTIPMNEFYVDPVNGNDNNEGTTASNPLKTLEKIKEKVRKVNKNLPVDIYVYLRGGNYNLSSPLRFMPEDGGQNGFFVIYKNFAEEEPVISGGKKISNWTIVPKKKYYQASVKVDDGFAPYFRQLYVNGKRAVIASKLEALHGIKWWNDPATPQTVDGIVFEKSQIKNYKTNVKDIRIFHPLNFKADYIPVIDIQRADSDYVFLLQQPYTQIRYNRGENMFGLNNNWYIQNALEELDTPGEWYLDQATQTVYYFPVPGEDMNDIEIYAPVIEPLISFEGTLGNKVKNIRFEGLVFEHGNWLYPRDTFIGGSQAEMLFGRDGSSGYNFQVPGQIVLNQTENVQFIMNVIRNSAGCGIHIYNGALNTKIEGNVFYGTTAAAILIGNGENKVPNDEQSEGTLISNNFITMVGLDFIQATGICLINPYNTKILHNEVSGTAYMGIHQRSRDRSSPDFPKVGGTEIGYNDVHDENWSVMRDNGAIYSFGYNPGSRIHHNWIHSTNGGSGYYNDNLSHNVLVDYNVSEKYLRMRDALVKTPPFQNWLENNYTRDKNVQVVGAKTSNNTLVSGEWPPEAQEIINNAGLEPEYKAIKKKFRIYP